MYIWKLPHLERPLLEFPQGCLPRQVCVWLQCFQYGKAKISVHLTFDIPLWSYLGFIVVCKIFSESDQWFTRYRLDMQNSQFENLTFSQMTLREISRLNRSTPLYKLSLTSPYDLGVGPLKMFSESDQFSRHEFCNMTWPHCITLTLRYACCLNDGEIFVKT